MGCGEGNQPTCGWTVSLNIRCLVPGQAYGVKILQVESFLNPQLWLRPICFCKSSCSNSFQLVWAKIVHGVSMITNYYIGIMVCLFLLKRLSTTMLSLLVHWSAIQLLWCHQTVWERMACWQRTLRPKMYVPRQPLVRRVSRFPMGPKKLFNGGCVLNAWWVC